MGDAENPFCAAARGEIPAPPAAALLGWKAQGLAEHRSEKAAPG